MPKTRYETATEIPADQKGAYAERADGKWYLTDLEDDHPVIQTKSSLEAAQSVLKNQVAELSGQKTELERQNSELSKGSVAEGYRAVPEEIAELGAWAKDEGLTKDGLSVLKTEHERYRQAEETRAQTKFYEDVAADESVGLNPKAFSRIALAERLVIEKVTERQDGRDVAQYVVVEKEPDGQERKTGLRDYIEANAAFEPFKASLYEKPEMKPNMKFPKQKERETTGGGGKTAAERRVEKQNQRLVAKEKSIKTGVL